MLRLANEDDIPELVDLIYDYIFTTPHANKDISKDKIEYYCNIAATDPNWVFIILEEDKEIQGFITGKTTSNFFSEENTSTAVLYYVLEEHRSLKNSKLLLKAFEHWAKNYQNSSYVILGNPMRDRLDKYYNYMGYRQTEMSFTKEL